MRLIDVSLDVLVAAGTSTATDDQLQVLESGDHDPRKRGFTLQNVELSFMGAVDPYFNAEAHIVYSIDPITGDSKFELEEAFFTTQKLPYGLQLKGGQFITEFGIINAQHPHQWDWEDAPDHQYPSLWPRWHARSRSQIGMADSSPMVLRVIFWHAECQWRNHGQLPCQSESFLKNSPSADGPLWTRLSKVLKTLPILAVGSIHGI